MPNSKVESPHECTGLKFKELIFKRHGSEFAEEVDVCEVLANG